MVEPLRHRQTKEAETDMFDLKPPRHTSTLPQLQTSALSRCPALRQFIKNRRSAGEWTRGAGVTPD